LCMNNILHVLALLGHYQRASINYKEKCVQIIMLKVSTNHCCIYRCKYSESYKYSKL